MRNAVLVMIALAGACVDSSSVSCGDGTTCPQGTLCAQITAPDESLCVTSKQIDDCRNAAEGDACDTGWCHDRVCIPIQCGNNRVDRGEVCDDGNTITGDGTCSGDCTSNEQCGNGQVDPLKLVAGMRVPNEQCDDGNLVNGDGCSSQCLTENPRWEQLDSDAIPPLEEASEAYDPSRNRLVLYGGTIDVAGKSVAQSEIYEWTGKTWLHIPTLGAPTARQTPGLAYDGVSHRMLMFGGHGGDDNSPFGDTWQWDGGTWTLLHPAHSPTPRTEVGMVYDSARKRIVLFGGFDGMHELDETWEWDGADWAPVTTANKPEARFLHAMTYDPVHGRVVMAGGEDETSASRHPRDTWAYDGTNWTLLDNTTTPSELDRQGAIAWDRAGGRVIASTGFDTVAGMTDDTTWAFNGTTWTNLGIAGPGPRGSAALSAFPPDGSLVMYGGFTTTTLESSTYLFTQGGWVLAATPSVPPPRFFATVASDPRHKLVWLFGGEDDQSNALGDTWSYDGESWTQHSVNPAPSPRFGAAMAYDQARDQLVLFGGGSPQAGGGTTIAPAETWIWEGTMWSLASPSRIPSARAGAAMAYDAKRQRVVLFGGGTDSNLTPSADTWEWDGTNWTQIMLTGPDARVLASAAFDPVAGKTILYGGFAIPNGKNDVWSYDGTSWTSVLSDAGVPSRFLPAYAYDTALRSIVMFGGQTVAAQPLGDTVVFAGSASTTLLTDKSPSVRAGALGFADPNGRGYILFSGVTTLDTGTGLAETWRLRYASNTPPELCTLDIDNDGDGLKGCADPDCWAQCSWECPPGTSCPASAPHCGDGTCDPNETCRMCPGDCGSCAAVCGDTFCDTGETLANCPGDCTP